MSLFGPPGSYISQCTFVDGWIYPPPNGPFAAVPPHSSSGASSSSPPSAPPPTAPPPTAPPPTAPPLPPSPPSDKCLVGFVEAKVVALQYYRQKFNGGEMVGLVREHLNAFDHNAIGVFNIRNAQLGYIEGAVAAVIAPLMDFNLITVKGVLQKYTGRRNPYKHPCDVYLFAEIAAFERVINEIGRGGLQLVMEHQPAFSLGAAVPMKEKITAPDEKGVDEIFNLLDEALSKEGALKQMEPPKDVIITELFPHQKEGLGWLVQRENSNDLPPFWEDRDGVYVNMLTNFETDKRPDPFLGGIFADDMGLGKSLTLLSLIANDKCRCSLPFHNDEADNNTVAGVGDKLKRKGSKRGNNVQKKQKTDGFPAGISVSKGPAYMCMRTTLIVCPTAVLSAWVKQLELHTRPGSLRTYLYYGERTKDANELRKYDIVLTTYSTLASEKSWEASPMHKVEWWRIILDEAHLIKNVNARQSLAVTNLNGKRRWVVTGTPIQNDSFDMFSLMAFLRLEPLSTKRWWNNYIAFPLGRGEKKGISRLQVLMATISLRRTKDKSLNGFPSKTVETFLVKLSAEEKDMYSRMEDEAKIFLRSYYSEDDSTRHYYTSVLSYITRLRQLCVDVALCPPDFQDLSAIKDASTKPELLNKLRVLVEDSDGLELDCPVCISELKDAVITTCAHIYCRTCILKTLRQSKQSCPLCRNPISESDIFFLPPDAPITGSSSANKSSKVIALLKLLTASQEENPARKSVVFSQFRKMLLILEETLKAAGFKVLRIDGSMPSKKRGEVIEEFSIPAPEGPTILLASLKATGAGVNLTAASRVYFLEPWWNPAVEEQAMDRIYRIGQTEEVKIVRLIARDTIEEKILALQEGKKLLARKAFGRAGPKEQREITRADIALLLDS